MHKHTRATGISTLAQPGFWHVAHPLEKASRTKADGGCTSEKGLQAYDSTRTGTFILADTGALNQAFSGLAFLGGSFLNLPSVMLLGLLFARFLILPLNLDFPGGPLWCGPLALETDPEAKISGGGSTRVRGWDSEWGRGKEPLGDISKQAPVGAHSLG